MKAPSAVKGAFPHSDDPIKGINGEVFKKINALAEVDWERMDDEICRGMAKSNLTNWPTVGGSKPPELIGDRPPLETELKFKGAEEPYERGMNAQETRRYRTFKRMIDQPWAFSIILKPNEYFTKERDLYPWSSVADRMPYTKQVIQSLPFEEVGRVVILCSWADSPVPCHRDEPTGDPKPHINFNPNHYRPVYVWDPIKKEKIYLPKDYKFYAYNVTDYHGVDPVPHFSYTVRVDGKYSKEFYE